MKENEQLNNEIDPCNEYGPLRSMDISALQCSHYLGDKLNSLLIDKGISGAKLSRDTGFSEASISNWRNNVTPITFENIKVLSNYFGEPMIDVPEETLDVCTYLSKESIRTLQHLSRTYKNKKIGNYELDFESLVDYYIGTLLAPFVFSLETEIRMYSRLNEMLDEKIQYCKKSKNLSNEQLKEILDSFNTSIDTEGSRIENLMRIHSRVLMLPYISDVENKFDELKTVINRMSDDEVD